MLRHTWSATPGDRGDVHVLPLDDLRLHVEQRDCWCAPDWIADEADGAVVVVHHAADGRDLVEQHGLH